MTKKKLLINLESPISFYPQLAKVVGGVEEAIFVQQLYYWTDKCEDKEGWVYKSKKEWEKETTLSRKIQDRIRKKLVEKGIIKVKKKKANGAPTLWYKLDIDRVNELLRANEKDPKGLMEKAQRGQWKSPNGANPYIGRTENTTKNTTENMSSDKSDDESPRITGSQINQLIELFKPLNPNYEKLFANKTQRKCLEELVKKYGYEKMENGLRALPKIVILPYSPTITTPCELQAKMGKLSQFLQKERNKGRFGKTPIIE